MRRRVVFPVFAALLSLFVALGIGEIGLRVAGYRPYEPVDWKIRVEPGGRYQERDAELGYIPLAGRYTVTFPNDDVWTMTHAANRRRITRPLDEYARPLARPLARPRIWLFGCSYVHGWGLDDPATMGWQLQEQLGDFEVENLGVGGYGTWQSLLQFRRAIASGERPALAILVYASFHDERNTRSRRWQRAVYEYDRFGTTASPYVRVQGDSLEARFDAAAYREFSLLRRLALANLLDLTYSRLQEDWLRSHRASELIVEQFAREAEAAGVHFAVVGIDPRGLTTELLEHAREKGIRAANIAVDPGDPRNRIRFDGHPSRYANWQHAVFLTRLVGEVFPEGAPRP